jgi:regulator of RNase E activity RraA
MGIIMSSINNMDNINNMESINTMDNIDNMGTTANEDSNTTDCNVQTEIIMHGCSGMYSDELDKLGYRNQVIDGLVSNNPFKKFYGRVRTLQLETVETCDENIAEGLGFIERLLPGEILCVEGSFEFAYFGELMSRIALRQKLGGVVIGGLTRDSYFTQNIAELLIFAQGYSPRDIKGRGRVKTCDAGIKIKNVPISPGDWAFGDKDGVVVIPVRQRSVLENRILRLINEEKSIISKIDEGFSIKEILMNHKEF